MSESVDIRNETVANLVKASLARVKQVQQVYVGLTSGMVSGKDGVTDDQLISLNIARQDAEANLDHALSLLNAASLAEVNSLQETFSRRETASGGSAKLSCPDTGKTEGAGCSIADAAVAAVTGGEVLQTMELDSSAIAAELEATVVQVPDVVLPDLQPVEVSSAAAANSDISAEIEALSARIHEAKARAHETRSATDDEVAAAVAAAELLDAEEEAAASVTEAAADLPLGHQNVVASSVDVDSSVEDAAAELEHMLIAGDNEVHEIEIAAVLEQTLEPSNAGIHAVEENVVAGAGNELVNVIKAPLQPAIEIVSSDAPVPANVVISPESPTAPAAEIEAALAASGSGVPTLSTVPTNDVPINIIADQTTVAGKSFSLDLAAQLDAVRAMIRGNAGTELAKEAAKVIGK